MLCLRTGSAALRCRSLTGETTEKSVHNKRFRSGSVRPAGVCDDQGRRYAAVISEDEEDGDDKDEGWVCER